MTYRPELSDRQLASLIGVANSTVSRRRQAVALQRDADDEPSAGDSYRIAVAAQDTARRFFRAMEEVWEARGLGIGDAIFGDRTGERLADVLEAAYGEDAIDRAKRYRVWVDRAIQRLSGR
jgi:transcriptional regulator with XRE-family HTH domain